MRTRGTDISGATIARLVGGVLLIDSVFYAAVIPILGQLAREFSLSKADVGVLLGAYPIAMVVAVYPAARAASRWGDRPCILGGLVAMALGCLGFALATDWTGLLVARLVQGVGGTLSWTGGLVWLGESAPSRGRAKILGTALGMGILGSQFGPVVGALASAVGRGAAFALGVLAAASLGLWAWSSRSRSPRLAPASPPARKMVAAEFWAGFWLAVLATVGLGVIDVLTPLQLYHHHVSSIVIGAIFLAASGCLAIVSRVTGQVIDRHGVSMPVRVAFVGSILAVLVLTSSSLDSVTAIAIIVGSASLGALWGPANHLISASARRHQVDESSAVGAFLLAWALGFAVGSNAAGILAQAGCRDLPYLLICGLCIVTLAVRPVRRACLGQHAHTSLA